MSIDEFVVRIQARRSGKGWKTKCPAHKDTKPSLAISEAQDGRILLHCHAGCPQDDVIAGVEKVYGISRSELSPAGSHPKRPEIVKTYTYADESGTPLFLIDRLIPKDFVARKPGEPNYGIQGVRRVLYNLPAVIKSQQVVIAEGEKDCDNLGRLDFTATCNPFGAGKWQDQYSDSLQGKDVIVFGDSDKSGRAHVQQIIKSLNGKAKSIKRPQLPDEFHDVSNFIASLPANMAAQTVAELIAATPLFDPAAKQPCATTDDDEIIAELAAMPLLEYERIREKKAKELRCRTSVLDTLVEDKRKLLHPSNGDSLQGTAVTLTDVEPWSIAVNGVEALDAIAATFAQYVALPDGAADVLALWCAHTHCFKASVCSPRLNVTSPEKQCGKTTLRDVIGCFVPRPVSTENMTTAVLFRLVHAQSPTILADECDGWLADNEELRSLFNSGHRRGGKVYRCEGDGNEVRGFDAYAPAVLCGIGNLPGTLHDRSIVIRLERAKRGELKARFDSRHVEIETELRCKLARWCADHRAELEAFDPQLPDSLFNRLADNWRPLFAIAEVVGGDWPERVASALAKLTSHGNEDVEGLRVMLLTDICQIFAGEYPEPPEDESVVPIERMFSRELIATLSEMKERPWPDVCRGKAITERWLARTLSAFGIKPKTLRIGADRFKGYEVDQFRDVFERYVPSTPPAGGI